MITGVADPTVDAADWGAGGGGLHGLQVRPGPSTETIHQRAAPQRIRHHARSRIGRWLSILLYTCTYYLAFNEFLIY